MLPLVHAYAFEFTSGAFLRPVRRVCWKGKFDVRKNCRGDEERVLSRALRQDSAVSSHFVFPPALVRILPSLVIPSSHASLPLQGDIARWLHLSVPWFLIL